MSTPRGIPRAAYRFFGRFPKPATFLRGLKSQYGRFDRYCFAYTQNK